jgi:hypothetical protein
MQEYEIEVIGHYSTTLTIEAETQEEAEILACEEFERDYVPYSNNNGWSDVWGWTEAEFISVSGDESEEY